MADGHRAREVIQGIRNMVRKSEASHALVEIKEVIRDLLRIVRADAIARNVSLIAEVDPECRRGHWQTAFSYCRCCST